MDNSRLSIDAKKPCNFRVCRLLKDFDSAELCDINMEISKMATLDKILPLITQQFVDQLLSHSSIY